MSNEWEVLKSSFLFETFDDRIINMFVEESEIRNYSADEIIFVEMTEGDEIFLVVDGEVTVEFALANEDQQFEIGTLQRGEIIGEVAFFENGQRSATVTAKKDTTMLVWKNVTWQQICEKDYEVGYRLVTNMAKILCQRLRRMNIRILDNVSWGIQ